MYQNQWEYGTSHELDQGKTHAQLRRTCGTTRSSTSSITIRTRIRSDFETFADFVEGDIAWRRRVRRFGAAAITGPYTIGAFVSDNFKLRSNLTITAGLRWDFDGPLTEKYGKLTAFNPGAYSYMPVHHRNGVPADPTTGAACDSGTDVINNSGFEVAGIGQQFPYAGAPVGPSPRGSALPGIHSRN